MSQIVRSMGNRKAYAKYRRMSLVGRMIRKVDLYLNALERRSVAR